MINSLNDNFILNNGIGIPCVGFGTWQAPDGAIALASTIEAIHCGYRHVDTAFAYENEKSIGEAVRESGVKREELFITSKLWNSERGYEKTLKAFEITMDNLKLDYLDLYLIHWPCNKKEGVNENADTWKAFEKLYRDGRIKSIGVSNFLAHHLESLLETAEVIPMVNQIEFHPGQMQEDVVNCCKTHQILVEAWGPLGQGKMLNNALLSAIATQYGRTVAQLCIRWCLQHDILPLPKSVTPNRILENAQVFDFTISVEDMNKIDSLPYIGGSGLNPDTINF